jgi:two-component system cell cycle response regulator CpdR
MTPEILLVDDDQSVRESLTKLLALAGYTVSPARDGAEAMECFNAGRVGLVILDINLGPESGWTLLEAMTALKPHVPVIVITAEWGQRAKAEAGGVKGLIEKPIDVPVFLALIQELLADGAPAKRGRLRTREGRCRYVSRHYEPQLRCLQQRYASPFHITSPGAPQGEPGELVPASGPTLVPACPDVHGWTGEPTFPTGQPPVPNQSPDAHETEPCQPQSRPRHQTGSRHWPDEHPV